MILRRRLLARVSTKGRGYRAVMDAIVLIDLSGCIKSQGMMSGVSYMRSCAIEIETQAIWTSPFAT